MHLKLYTFSPSTILAASRVLICYFLIHNHCIYNSPLLFLLLTNWLFRSVAFNLHIFVTVLPFFVCYVCFHSVGHIYLDLNHLKLTEFLYNLACDFF